MARLDQTPDYLSPDAPPVPWRVRAVVGFVAGLFVATLFAVFSAGSRESLGDWWMVAMVFAVCAWCVVAGCEWAVRVLKRKLGPGGGRPPRALAFVVLLGAALGVVAGIGWIVSPTPLGVVWTALPFVLAVAIFWHGAGRVSIVGVGVAAAVLFLICVRLFTLPGAGEFDPPQLVETGEDDVLLMTWNVGGGAPFFRDGDEGDIAAVAAVVKRHGIHLLCLQGVGSRAYVDRLAKTLGEGWRGYMSRGPTAVLSRIGGVLEEGSIAGVTVVRIASDKGRLQFASCQADRGRDSKSRRRVVDWVLNEVRAPNRKTVLAGDFQFDPAGGWTFLSPLFSDAPGYDRATWRALGVLGRDPGAGGPGTGQLSRRTGWVIVDRGMSVSGYQVLASVQVDGIDHRPVLVRVDLGKEEHSGALDVLAVGPGGVREKSDVAEMPVK